MNIFALIILITLAVDFILSLASDILNLKHLSGDLPREFKDVYDKEKYARSQEYTRVNTRFGWLTSGFSLVVTLAFWFSGGFNFLDAIARNWNLHPIWTGLSYIGILIGIKTIISLPFSIYDTFVIEERFEFNKTTPTKFCCTLGII